MLIVVLSTFTGSEEEKNDVVEAYVEGNGSIEHIMAHIPHTTYEDETRIIAIVKGLIKSGQITSLPDWEASLKDEKAKKARKKKGKAEAVQAEESAKELGVWDEFYGTGKKGKRQGKSKGPSDETAGLQALIQRRAANRTGPGSFLDNLAAKYGVSADMNMDMDDEPKPKRKGKAKKRARDEEAEDSDEEEIPNKRRKTPELDDAEFERIQMRLEAEKAKKLSSKNGTGSERVIKQKRK